MISRDYLNLDDARALLKACGNHDATDNRIALFRKDLNIALGRASKNALAAPSRTIGRINRFANSIAAARQIIEDTEVFSLLQTIAIGSAIPAKFPKPADVQQVLAALDEQLNQIAFEALASNLNRRSQLDRLICKDLPSIYQKYAAKLHRDLLPDRFIVEVLKVSKVRNTKGKVYELEAVARRRQRIKKND